MASSDPANPSCPQCGASLITYTLGESAAPVCERCEWVGIDADHHPEGAVDESWDAALRRFYRRHADPRQVTEGEGKERTDDDPEE